MLFLVLWVLAVSTIIRAKEDPVPFLGNIYFYRDINYKNMIARKSVTVWDRCYNLECDPYLDNNVSSVAWLYGAEPWLGGVADMTKQQINDQMSSFMVAQTATSKALNGVGSVCELG
ncbi:hypothetical protein PHMEG_00029991 [Phytophthora megakarya]|uniref:Uncharacterized protein n=1 Tax=Phytophthora megakarya TaxID=4795 RepID=A0A225V268_9STRA|nr:hypothetical protein PHMEG_00029991 [Phytophthora megakarya]